MSSSKDEVVISVKDVKKDFHIPRRKTDSLKEIITQAFKSKESGYDVFHALNGVSFDIKRGEFFGVLGRNGTGKSTLLKILAEIYQPTSGSVSVKGKLVPFIELGVGFNPNLSGRENVYLNGALLGFSKSEIDARYDAIVEFAELEDFMEQKLKNYSSGMKVRLAFAVAIQADADILLLDEVLAVGDAAFQRKCYNYFKSLKDNNKTIVFVTHNMSAAKEYCDRGILIEGGTIVKEGDIEEVADAYTNLFSVAPSKDTKKTEARNGDGSVVVDSCKATITDDDVQVVIKLKASSQPVSSVVLGLVIKDDKGTTVAGMSTRNAKGAALLEFDSDETKELVFDMPNMFRKQTYVISSSVLLADGITVCDVWGKACSFIGTRDKANYPIVCPAQLTIRK